MSFLLSRVDPAGLAAPGRGNLPVRHGEREEGRLPLGETMSKSILIVDDSASMRQMVSFTLRERSMMSSRRWTAETP